MKKIGIIKISLFSLLACNNKLLNASINTATPEPDNGAGRIATRDIDFNIENIISTAISKRFTYLN